MRRLVLSAVSVAAASSLLLGCATVSPQRHEGPMGSLTGVVTLPSGAEADAVCGNLQVALHTASGQSIGDSSVHASRGRCLYTVDYVKANEPLTLSVQASAPRACESGTLQQKDAPGTIQVKERETRTLDLALHCA